MALDANGFRQAMGFRAAGVTVVTTRDRHGEPRGLTATAVCSVSLTPPLILVCIDRIPGGSRRLRRGAAG